MYSMRMHCIYRGEYSRLLVTDNGYGVPHCTADIAPAAPAAPAADAGWCVPAAYVCDVQYVEYLSSDV